MIVRTLDAGADKPLPFLRQAPEANPFLGVRGIRLSLAEPELFAHPAARDPARRRRAPAEVMFPMVATLDELRAARALLDAARAELGSDAQLEVGVMVEVPALALAGRRVRRRGRLLLDRHQRPRPVHDGRRARQRGARGAARRRAGRRCSR